MKEINWAYDWEEEDPYNDDYIIYFLKMNTWINDGWRFYPTYKKRVLGREEFDKVTMKTWESPKILNEINTKHYEVFINKLRNGKYLLSNARVGKTWTLKKLCKEYPKFEKYL